MVGTASQTIGIYLGAELTVYAKFISRRGKIDLSLQSSVLRFFFYEENKSGR